MQCLAGSHPAMPVLVKNEQPTRVPEKISPGGNETGDNDMTSMKILSLMLLVIFLLIPACSGGSVPDQNVTIPPAQLFITINHIGNHALGEIFTLSGTTNLPKNQTIQIEIEADSPLVPKIGPGVFGGGVWYTTVVAGEGTATNRWSVIINLSGYNQTLVSSKNFLVRAADASTFNVTSTSEFGIAESYITIDPVGNHTLDEVFFISGTTDLPASGTSLLLQIYSTNFNPGGGGSAYQSNVTIEPGENGINTWSCNVTTSLWQTYGLGPPFPVADAVPGEYLVTVVSPDPKNPADATRIFFILSSEDTGNTTAANPGLTPYHTNQYVHAQRGYWISVDHLPLGTHFVGDTFKVSGATNLPAGQEIDYGAFSAAYAPGSPNLLPPSCSGSTIVDQGTGEINTWSFVVNTSRFEKTLENGSVIRMAAVPGNYELSIGPFNQELYPFTLTDTVPDSQVLLKNTSLGTTAETGNPPRVVPTTHEASLPLAVSIAATGLGAAACMRCKKK